VSAGIDTVVTVTGHEDTERQRLIDGIAAMQDALDTTALPSMLEPLMSMDITLQQLRVLIILVSSDRDGSTGQGISRALGISMASTSGILDRLEGHAMVKRVEDDRDHRVRRVLITPLGRRTVNRLVSAQSQLSREPLKQLDVDDLRALEQGMRAILRVMGIPAAQ
jgi:DNA-binding MarR family transcriptional regulator